MIWGRRVKFILFEGMLLSLLIGCDTPSSVTVHPPSNVPDQTATTKAAPFESQPTSQPGMASLNGMLHSYTVDQDLPETLYYLTRGVGEANDILHPVIVGPLDENDDIRGFTDSDGRLTAVNIPPGRYFVIVWAPPYNWEPVVVSPQDPTPLLIELEADENLTIETFFVSWP
jgi:hypothetical protein